MGLPSRQVRVVVLGCWAVGILFACQYVDWNDGSIGLAWCASLLFVPKTSAWYLSVRRVSVCLLWTHHFLPYHHNQHNNNHRVSLAELRSENPVLAQRLRHDPLRHMRALEAACHAIAAEERPGYDKDSE